MDRFRVQEAVLALLYPPEERKWTDSGYREQFLCCCTRRKSEKGQMPGTDSGFLSPVPVGRATCICEQVSVHIKCHAHTSHGFVHITPRCTCAAAGHYLL